MAAASKTPFSDRHDAGRARIGTLVRFWLPRSKLSQDQINAVASWGTGEVGSLDSSKISQLRNERILKISLRDLDALATLNEVIHRWQVEGPEAARARWGPPSAFGVQDAWLDDACWLSDPADPGQPLGFAQLCAYFAGYLEISAFDVSSPVASHGQRLSEALAGLIDAEVRELGLGAGLAKLTSCYPDQSATARIEQLRAVALGLGTYSPSQFEAELCNLAETVRLLRGRRAGSYGPDQLRAELSERLQHPG